MTAYGIRIFAAALPGITTEHDGRWLKFYDPKVGKHGRIVSTADVREAKRFPDSASAMVEYQRAHGLRPDRKPNRPLTAWTVGIFPLPEEDS